MKTYLFFLLLLTLCIFNACAPTYNPTPSQPALFSEAGQAKVSASYSGRAGNLQAGVALSDNFALITTLNAFKNTYSYSIGSTVYSDESNGVNWDILPGYYTTFGENGIAEVFAGFGTGRVSSPGYDGRLNKLYLQPSIGWKGDITEGALTMRMTELFLPMRSVTEERRVFFLEPMFSFGIGGERLRVYTQMGISISPKSLSGAIQTDYNPFLWNLGLQFQLAN